MPAARLGVWGDCHDSRGVRLLIARWRRDDLITAAATGPGTAGGSAHTIAPTETVSESPKIGGFACRRRRRFHRVIPGRPPPSPLRSETSFRRYGYRCGSP